MFKFSSSGKLWLVWAMFFTGLMITVFATLQVRQHIEQEAESQFLFMCERVAVSAQDRLNTYALLLNGSAGLFAASGRVGQQEWQHYVDKLQIAKMAPGIQGMSFASLVHSGELAAHIARIRAEGNPEYTVTPAGEHEFFAPVIYISPLSARNKRVLGYDNFSDSLRRTAMERARDTGEVTLTGKLALKQEDSVDAPASVIMFTPVYRMPVYTVENRRRAIIGWVAGVFRMNDLMRAVLQKSTQEGARPIGLKIYAGPAMTAENLLFDNMSIRDAPSQFYLYKKINLGGGAWTLAFDRASALSGIRYTDAWAVLIGGVALSGLLFSLMLSLINTRARAARIAGELTSEIRRNQDFLIDSEYRLTFATEGVGDGIWDWNMASNAMQFSALYMDMLGYAEFELPHQADTWDDSVHPEDMARVQENLRDYLEGKIPSYLVELRLRCKDGSYKWIQCRGRIAERDSAGSPVRMIGIHSDISMRKLLEKKLNDALAISREILTQSPSGIAVFKAEGSCVMANEAYAKMFGVITATGFSADAALIRLPTELCNFAEHVFESKMVCRHDFECETKSGQKQVLECLLSYIEIAEEAHLLLISNDVSARVEATCALNQSMLQIQKKELAKTRFMAAAGHDLRQPLAAANMFIYALRFSATTPEQHELIQNLMLSMSTFKGLLDTLLQVSKLDSGLITPEYSSINVAELMIWMEQSFAASANDKNIDFKLYFPLSRLVFIRSDLGLIKSVLMNLVSNAIKFTSKGGVMISARARGGEVLIQVWDTGVGIADDKMEYVFDEFYQIGNPQRDREGGQGLGLSIVKRTLALLGVEIGCRSQLGRGTVFEFLMPVASGVETLVVEPLVEPLVDNTFVQGRQFVLVEDDLIVAQATIAWLNVMGAQVTCFHSAEAALREIDAGCVDYYIVDYMLGGTLNGIEMLNRLQRKSGKRLKAVLVTGDTSGAFLRASVNFDWPVQYKPVNSSALLASLSAQDGKIAPS